MDIYINGEFVARVTGNATEAATVAQRYLLPGHGFGRVWVDGIPYAGVEALGEVGSAPCQRLDLEALSATELADQTATTLLEYLERLCPYVADLASSLRFGEAAELEKLEILALAVGYVEAAQNGVAAVDQMQGASAVNLEVQSLVKHLEDVVEALERDDRVDAADILEYVIFPELKAIETRMRTRAGAESA